MIKINSAKDLDKLYTESEEVDKSQFAQMRSGLLLVSGDHYNKRNSQFSRLKQASDLQDNVRIRLTKNHLGRIVRKISNTIVTASPGVTVSPKHKKELSDQKSAELHQAIWQDIKERNDFPNLVQQWADDFVGIGEVWAKLFWDETAGPIVGYYQLNSELDNTPVVDEMGQPVPDKSKPLHQGQLKFEEIFAFNVLRDKNAQSLKDSTYFCIRKSVKVDNLKSIFGEAAEGIGSSNDAPFMVFSAGDGYRRNSKDEVLVKEWYFKPCLEYPTGYYYIHASGKILDEGELPDGIFPIVCERYESIQTKCRGYSAVDPIRHSQLELNRAVSKIAETQITLGDDKLILQNGSKISAGATLPGIRTVSVSGSPPTVMPGRSGEQYVAYAQNTVTEMYSLADLEEEEFDGNLEPHTLLYRAASQKKKFVRYIKPFEGFLKRVCQTSLRMAKYYMPEDMVVYAVGRNEQVNVSEFKNATDQSLEVVIEAQADDIETKLGRQLTIQHALQYVGSNMDQNMIGKLIKSMPYANIEATFSDLTMNDDMATNDLLALDRGSFPIINQTQPHEFLINKATMRMNQADFEFLPKNIEQAYEQYIAAHLDIVKQQKDATLRAQSGFIPDGGAMIGVDYFIQDPNNPERTRRARFPYQSIDWLYNKLQDQGSFKSQMNSLPESAQAQMAPPEQGVPVAEGSQAEVVSPSPATMA